MSLNSANQIAAAQAIRDVIRIFVDPTVTAVRADAGTIFIQKVAPYRVYIKKTTGLDTNVDVIADGLDSVDDGALNSSTVQGNVSGNTASAQGSFAGGGTFAANTVTGQDSFAHGDTNNVAGAACGVFGGTNTIPSVDGNNSLVAGLSNSCDGNSSLVTGQFNTVNTNAQSNIVGGEFNVISGVANGVFGKNNTCGAAESLNVGTNNDSPVGVGKLAQIGAFHTVNPNIGQILHSLQSGHQSEVKNASARVLSSGRIAANGDAQTSDHHLFVQVNDAGGAGAMAIDKPALDQSISLPDETSYAIKGQIVARGVGGAVDGQCRSFNVDALIEKSAGVFNIVGGAAAVPAHTKGVAAAAWTATLQDDGAGNINIATSNDNNEEVRWSAYIQLTEIAG